MLVVPGCIDCCAERAAPCCYHQLLESQFSVPGKPLPVPCALQKLTDEVFSSCLKSRDYMQAKNALLALNRCVKVGGRGMAACRLGLGSAPRSWDMPLSAALAFWRVGTHCVAMLELPIPSLLRCLPAGVPRRQDGRHQAHRAAQAHQVRPLLPAGLTCAVRYPDVARAPSGMVSSFCHRPVCPHPLPPCYLLCPCHTATLQGQGPSRGLEDAGTHVLHLAGDADAGQGAVSVRAAASPLACLPACLSPTLRVPGCCSSSGHCSLLALFCVGRHLSSPLAGFPAAQ